MVATIAAGTDASYYSKQSEYYIGGCEPAGRWISATNNFGVTHGAIVDNSHFTRLHDGLDESGRPLLTNPGDAAKRVAGIDLTLSAPKSASIAYALADDQTRREIEVAHHRACEATIAFLDRHAAFCRRGRNGIYQESVSLTSASFQHAEARPVVHSDGQIFADPNLHAHNVIINAAIRADGTIGALDARHLFAHKMAAGAIYHVSLATELQRLGFGIQDIGKNGTFEIAGVPRDLKEYFSARRREIEEAIATKGLTTSEAPVLAAAIALGTRTSKKEGGPDDRFALWAEKASRFVEIERFVAKLQNYQQPDPQERNQVIAARMAALPDELTAHESVFEARHFYAAVATALVGTGADAERVEAEAQHFIETGLVVELGRDKLSQPVYSTAAQIEIERKLLTFAERLAGKRHVAPDMDRVAALCRARGLNDEQTRAAHAATSDAAVVIAEGAAGAGKTTMLGPVVAAHQNAGMRVVGTATAWKIATQLKDDLGIQAKATDAWIASARAGGKFLDRNTVLVVDEAGLLSSRQMLDLLTEVEKSGAKAIFVGDTKQLQTAGSGPSLTILSSVINSTRVDRIVRQHDAWAREAITYFANGRAVEGLQAYNDRGLLSVAAGEKPTIQRLVDAWAATQQAELNPTTLLIAKTNAQVRALNAEVRSRLKASGHIRGEDVAISAVTPSGRGYALHLAIGDRVRFFIREDQLGVVNGSTATITHIDNTNADNPTVSVAIGDRLATFKPSDLADEQGRARLGHAYASTIYGSQGLTTDRAFVLLDPSMNRHDIYVATSRARFETEHFLNAQACDAHIKLELPLSERRGAVIGSKMRMAWLAARLSRAHVKSCTLDLTLELATRARSPERDPARGYDRG